MPIDLRTIKSKARSLFTLQHIVSTTTLAVLVIINWDVLVSRYREFADWAPGVATAVGQVFSILISLVVVAVLHTTISSLLELVYFGPLKRLNKLEREANEKLSKLQGRSFCQSMLLGVLAVDLTYSQSQDLEELAEILKEKTDGPMKEGAMEAFNQFSDVAESVSPKGRNDSE